MSSTVQPGMMVMVRSAFWLPEESSSMMAFTSMEGERSNVP